MRIGVALALFAAGSTGVAVAQQTTVTLDEAVALAVRVNPTVVQARGQLAIAGAGRREAIGNWLPTLTGSSSWSTQSVAVASDVGNFQRASTSYSAGLNASLELFDGFRRAAQNRSAGAGVASADATLTNQEFQIVLQTKQTFFTALAADELVRVAQGRIAQAEEQLKVSRDRLAAGSAIRSDTLRSRVELGNAQLQLLNAQTQRATAEADLARLVGYDGTVRAVADSALLAPVVLDTALLRSEALANSPQVLEAEASERGARAQLAVTRAQYFPSITATYSNSFSGAELSDLSNSWSLRVGLSWPIFNGFTRETGMARSGANLDAAFAQREDARRQVNAQLTQYLAALEAAQQRVEIAQTSAAAAEEDLRVQRERYRLGAATIVEVLISQVALDQASVDRVQARLDYLVAKAQIEALIGREL